MEETDISYEQAGRRFSVGRNTGRERNKAIDSACTALSNHSEALRTSATESVDVSHRKAVPEDQNTPGGNRLHKGTHRVTFGYLLRML